MFYRLKSCGGVLLTEIQYQNQLGHWDFENRKFVRIIEKTTVCSECFSKIPKASVVTNFNIDILCDESELDFLLKKYCKNCGYCGETFSSVLRVEPRDCQGYNWRLT